MERQGKPNKIRVRTNVPYFDFARMPSREITRTICDRLLALHRTWGWRAETERWFGNRRIDVLGISEWAEKVIGFEIKVSIEDFKQDVRDPDKRLSVARFCSGFYYVTQWNLLDPAKIPSGCGLIEMNDAGVFCVCLDGGTGDTVVDEVDRAVHVWHEEFWEPERRLGLAEEASDELPAWLLDRPLGRPKRIDFDVEAAAKDECHAKPFPNVPWSWPDCETYIPF